MKHILMLLGLLCTYTTQAQYTIRVYDAAQHTALQGVTISDARHLLLATTDSSGTANIHTAPEQVMLSSPGYLDRAVTFSATDTVLELSMQADNADLGEVTIVTATRNNGDIENSPLKVEVLGKEELGEEAGIKPGNIASLLSDVSGVQIQQSSATTGNSNVRIQGLDGRYTQILRDGMPLYDGFSGGFGIMTIPPLDLQQIELVKGSASTLYGGGAIGGLVNMVSRRPSMEQEADVLVNYTTLKEANANAYIAKRGKKWGYNLFTGYTNQQAVDVNGDGLSDLPRSNSFLAHPRLFFYPSARTTVMAGYAATLDDRKGGDMQVLEDHPDPVHQYYERIRSLRNTGEYLVEHFINGQDAKLTFKGNISDFTQQTDNNTYAMKARQLSYYNEISVLKFFGKHSLVAGVNITGDDYKTFRPDTAALHHFRNFTAGAFAQFSWHLGEQTTLEAGMRLDHHQRYGFFALPRVALFHRFDPHWATRLGFGMGYKTPNPLVQQNIEYNPLDLLPPADSVHAEKSYGYNAELNYKKEWAAARSFFTNLALFLTQVQDPILFTEQANGKISLQNANRPLLSMGADMYVKAQLNSWELYAGYTYTDARRQYMPVNSFVPLTPRNRAAFVIVKELAKKWRFGLEGSYMGSQYRYDGTATTDYFFFAAMVQRNIGKHITLVLNGENLLDFRMSGVETLYTGSISNPMFKPLWAPIDGRVINLSLRWKL